MAGPDLIEDYLAALARRLPAAVVAELSDGLRESYESRRRDGADVESAQRAAVSEFGSPDVVVAAFVAASPGRAVARRLLAAGPLVGLAWASILLEHRGMLPPAAVDAFAVIGIAVVAAVLLLVWAAFGSVYRQVRDGAVAGCLLVLTVDLAALGLITEAGLLTRWPLPLAGAVSLIRVAFTLRQLARLLTIA